MPDLVPHSYNLCLGKVVLAGRTHRKVGTPQYIPLLSWAPCTLPVVHWRPSTFVSQQQGTAMECLQLTLIRMMVPVPWYGGLCLAAPAYPTLGRYQN